MVTLPSHPLQVFLRYNWMATSFLAVHQNTYQMLTCKITLQVSYNAFLHCNHFPLNTCVIFFCATIYCLAWIRLVASHRSTPRDSSARRQSASRLTLPNSALNDQKWSASDAKETLHYNIASRQIRRIMASHSCIERNWKIQNTKSWFIASN